MSSASYFRLENHGLDPNVEIVPKWVCSYLFGLFLCFWHFHILLISFNKLILPDLFLCFLVDWIVSISPHLIGVPSVGAINQLHRQQMHGVLHPFLQIQIVLLVRQAISVVALHLLEVALVHQQLGVTGPMNLMLMHGDQVLDHRLPLGLWHWTMHHSHPCALTVLKLNLVAHNCHDLQKLLKIQWLGILLLLQRKWYHACNLSIDLSLCTFSQLCNLSLNTKTHSC